MILYIHQPILNLAESILHALLNPYTISDSMLDAISEEIIYLKKLEKRVWDSYKINLVAELTPTLRYIIDQLDKGHTITFRATKPNEYYAFVKVPGKPDRKVHISVVMACLKCFEQNPGLRNYVMDGYDLMLMPA